MAEYIRKEDALAAILSVPDGNWKNTRYASEIEKLPAVDVVERASFKETCTLGADDLISRQAAIDIVSEWLIQVFGIYETDNSIGAFRRLRKLPSAHPEQKTGRWIWEPDRRNHWHCSECEYVVGLMKMDSKYCPNCGSYNGGDNDV